MVCEATQVKSNFYDAAYYETGIESGKSCYQNYRWMPEHTMSMAMTMIDLLKIGRKTTVLDFGCSKGYLVKAFRLLHRQAWGFDLSYYAISNVDEKSKDYCFVSKYLANLDKLKELGYDIPTRFDLCIAKDVFEHIEKEELKFVLWGMPADGMFVVVPLGENGEYRAVPNNFDKSHVTCESETWWFNFFNQNGWSVIDFKYEVKGIKDSYYEKYPTGHGFYTMRRKTGVQFS